MTDEEIKREKELRRLDRAIARKEEWEKIRRLGGKARLRYFWDYYKFVLVTLLIVFFTGYVVVTMVVGTNTKTLLYTCIMNVNELDTDEEQLAADFAESIGGIGKREEIVFDISLRTDPEAAGTSQLDVANTMKMTALLQSAILDVFLAPPDVTQYLQEQGMLQEMDDLLDSDLKAECSADGNLYYASRPVYDEQTGELLLAETEADAEAPGQNDCIYAVRIDQAGVLEKYGIHEGNEIWFSVAGNSKREDMGMELLDFLLNRKTVSE